MAAAVTPRWRRPAQGPPPFSDPPGCAGGFASGLCLFARQRQRCGLPRGRLWPQRGAAQGQRRQGQPWTRS
eukprot:221736-Alexandrium_andersonii.AAC.1